MATSYSNPGGQGDRRSGGAGQLVVVTMQNIAFSGGISNGLHQAIVNGDKPGAPSSSNANYFNSVSEANDNTDRMCFTFVNRKIINEISWFQDVAVAATHGMWQVQGSNSTTLPAAGNHAAWTNIGAPFALGGAATTVINAISANTTGYLHYCLQAISGNRLWDSYNLEIEFKLEDAAIQLDANLSDGATVDAYLTTAPGLAANLFDGAVIQADNLGGSLLLDAELFDQAAMQATISTDPPRPLPIQVVVITLGG